MGKKVLATEEENDLSKLKVEELIGNLMSYEVNFNVKMQYENEKISITCQVEDDSDTDNNDMANLAKGFKKYLKSKMTSNNFNGNSSAMKCFEYEKMGHIKRYRPKLILKTSPRSNRRKNQRKGHFKSLGTTPILLHPMRKVAPIKKMTILWHSMIMLIKLTLMMIYLN